MTLIAAFKCSDGVVICGDSQETLGLPLPDEGYVEYRVTVDKVKPQRLGHYDAVIAGAGNGPLVEGFAETLADEVKGWDAALGEGELKSKIRNLVLDYHRNEVAVSSAREKEIQFLICLKDQSDFRGNIHLWVVRETAIKRVTTYELIGWEEGLYRHDIARHYKENEKSLFSMLVGVHVLMLARNTSNYVGGPLKIVAATPMGFRALDAGDTAELERRVADFDAALDKLRLRICDTTIPLDDFNQSVAAFEAAVLDLRTSLTQDVILAKFLRLKDPPQTVEELSERLPELFDPYLGLPTYEQSIRALRVAWESHIVTRRTKRGLAVASWILSHAVRVAAELNRLAAKRDLITVEQRVEFARRLLQINRAHREVLDDLKGIKTDPVADALVVSVYARLTEQVVEPLLEMVQEFNTLSQSTCEQATQMVQSLYSAMLSIFTTALISPVGKEPSSLPDDQDDPKQLGS